MVSYGIELSLPPFIYTMIDLENKTSPEQDSKEVKKITCPLFEAFIKQFDDEKDIDLKIQLAMEFMEASLTGPVPRFRSFWEVRKICLPLFKESGSSVLRNQIWMRYIDLSKEARRLKDQLDEQSAFAVEQIEIAINGLESDIERVAEIALAEKSIFDSLNFPKALDSQLTEYENFQQTLNVYNAHAARINALRKELLKTDMRIRNKNKFFQRLSIAGDKVFPPRKELIIQVSQRFIDDVNQFVKDFAEDLGKEHLFFLREEIKSFQGLAKTLTLNTHSFNQTRLLLSECWDKLKQEDKLFKQEKAQQKVVFRQNAEMMRHEIANFKEHLEKNEQTIYESLRQVDNIVSNLRISELGKDEIQALKKELNEIKKPLEDQLNAIEEARQLEETQRQEQKKEKFRACKQQSEDLITNHEQHSADELISLRDEITHQIGLSDFSKIEKQEIERVLKPIKDVISEKREKALLALSADDLQSLQQLKEILKQRKERRQEIKSNLEQLRKTAASSGLDFEKAMQHQAQTQEEKVRLDRANQSVQEIEEKITEIEKKI
jgi:hypothetical protein